MSGKQTRTGAFVGPWMADRSRRIMAPGQPAAGGYPPPRTMRRAAIRAARAACLAIPAALMLALLPAGGSEKAAPTSSPVVHTTLPRLRLPASSAERDGFYLLLRASRDQFALGPLGPDERALIHKHRFMPKAERPRDRFLVVRTAPDVHLELRAEPEWVHPDSGGGYFQLALSPECAEHLARLLEARPEQEVAILIGDEVVTVYPGKALPTEGELQIPCSLEWPCQHLYERLLRDVQGAQH